MAKFATFRARSGVSNIIGQLYYDLAGDYHNSILLVGSGRSGTTWVAELLNFDNSFRLIFEPLNRRHVPLANLFSGGLYLRPTDNNPLYLEPIAMILNGKLRNIWTDQFNRQPFPRKRLIKENGANLLLPWIQSHFSDLKIILVIRHPGAVVKSRLENKWPHTLDGFLAQTALVSDFLSPFLDHLLKAKSPFELLLYRWCIENYVPLTYPNSATHLVFYENLSLNPELEISRLFSFLNKQIDSRIFYCVNKPSRTTAVRRHQLPSKTLLVHGWRMSFSKEDVCKIQNALELFGLETLYREDGMPSEDALKF